MSYDAVVMSILLIVGVILLLCAYVGHRRLVRQHRISWERDLCHKCGMPDFVRAGKRSMLGFTCRNCLD